MAKKQSVDELKEVCSLLENTDVNDEAHRERIYNRLKYRMEAGTIPKYHGKEEGIYMKRNIKKTIAIAVLAFVCLTAGFSTTAFGQGIIQSIAGYFHVGNITITQYDKELPKVEASVDGDKKAVRENTTQKSATIEEARAIMKTDFAVPTWLPDGYKYMNSVIHSENGVELQYTKDESLVSLLISKDENGISTAGEVKEETIAGKTVYFANGIVLWGQDGLTYELYQMDEKNFDRAALEKIIGTMSAGTEGNNALYSQN